ncbi:MAG: hypothetical protein AAGG48_00325 [Planctomycetota bacterium]
MRRWLQRIAIVFICLVVLGMGTYWWALNKTKHVPEFYARAMDSTPESTEEASRLLTAGVEQLQSDVAQEGSWCARFSAAEINAWLIEELPKKFPQLSAKGASEPRIVIEDGRLLAAVRYRNSRFDTVISCEMKVELTEEPNMLALQVNQLKAGALPLPLSKFLRGITKEAAKGDIDIRWDETDQGPIALVTVPSEHPNYVLNPVIVESVTLVEGGLVLSGHTGPQAMDDYQPSGPVHQFVSYRHGEKRRNQPSQLSSRRDDSGTEFR